MPFHLSVPIVRLRNPLSKAMFVFLNSNCTVKHSMILVGEMRMGENLHNMWWGNMNYHITCYFV